MPLLALDAVGAGALYLALSTVPRDELDEDALTGIEVGAFVATACAAASLLLGFALRRTLRSRWWPVPAVALLVAGAARFAYVEIVHPSG